MLHQNISRWKFKQKLVNLWEGGEEMRRDRLIVFAICIIIAFILATVILSTTKMKPAVFFALLVICSVAMSEKRG